MLNKLISKLVFLVLISAAVYSQSSNPKSSNVFVLNRNINESGGYAQSTALIGYPPYSDVWIMHSSGEQNGSSVYTGNYIYRGSPVLYSVLPEYRDPYIMYLSAGDRWTPEAAEAVAVTTDTKSTVVYRNYVRPTDNEDYFVNYLEPAPVVTLHTNTNSCAARCELLQDKQRDTASDT